jgi:hypothetical protein
MKTTQQLLLSSFQSAIVMLVAFGFTVMPFAPVFSSVQTAEAATSDVEQLEFTLEPESSLNEDEKGGFILQTQDSGGNEVTLDTTVEVGLSSPNTNGFFYGGTIDNGDVNCNNATLSNDRITLNSGTAQKAFCYSNNDIGQHEVSAGVINNGSITSVSTTVSITSNKPVHRLDDNGNPEAYFGTIDEALRDSQTTSNDIIVVEEGVYEPADTLEINDKGLKLKSANSSSDKPVIKSSTGQGPVLQINAKDVTVSGLEVTGAEGDNEDGQGIDVNGDEYTTNGVILRDLVVRDNHDRGLVVDYSDNVTIEDVRVEDNMDPENGGDNPEEWEDSGDADGITLWYTNNSQLTDVQAISNGDNGIYAKGNNNSFTNITVKNNGDEGLDISSDSSDVMGGATVEELTAIDNNAEAVEIEGNESNVSIENATLERSPVGLKIKDNNGSVSVENSNFKKNNVQVKDSGESLDMQATLNDNNNTFDNAVAIDRPENSLVHTVWSDIQGAIDSAQSGDTIKLLTNFTTSEQITIDESITLEGNNKTINADFAKVDSRNNSVIGVASDDVSINDLTVDGSQGTDLHGINVYTSNGVEVNNVILNDNDHSGLLVNGSEVNASNISTNGNGWHAINVDQGDGVSESAILNIGKTSSHGEDSPSTPGDYVDGESVPHIFIDRADEADAIVNDEDDQYNSFRVPFRGDQDGYPNGNEAKVYTLNEEPEGDNTLRVCKLIVDSEGKIFDGSKTNSEFSLTINSATSPDSEEGYATTSDFSTTTTFDASLNLTDNLFTEDVPYAGEEANDVQCKTIENLPDGNYAYDQESINPDGQWESAQYNDGSSGTPSGLNDFANYSGELFNENPSDDGNRNYKSDGDIPLSDGETRTLTIKNTYKEPAPDPGPGSISVCKLIVDRQGNAINGSDHNATFTLPAIAEHGAPQNGKTDHDLGTTTFNTPIEPNADLLKNTGVGDSEKDAACVTKNNLQLGNYYYDQEDISGSKADDYGTPHYSDFLNTPGNNTPSDISTTTSAFDVYSNELFTDGTGDDAQRDQDRDGHIVLNENRPDRTIVVANQLSGETAGEQCIPEAKLDLDTEADGANAVTKVSVDSEIVNNGNSFNLLTSGSTAASNANTSDGEVRIEQTTTGFKLYFDGVSPGDTQQFKGSIKLSDVDLSGYSTSTISGAPLEDGSNGGFVDEVSVDEQNSKIDFRLRVGGGNDSFVISGIEKSCEPEEPNGAVKITKYSCDPGTQINADGVTQKNAAPESCDSQSGVKFSATFQDKEANGGFSETPGTTTISGETNENGMVTIDGLDTDGRYLFQELKDNGQPQNQNKILHFACEDDDGTKSDNKEISFLDEGQTDECVIYNERSSDDGGGESELLSCQPDKIYHLKNKDYGSTLVNINSSGGQVTEGDYGSKFGTLAIAPDEKFYAIERGSNDLVTLNGDDKFTHQATTSLQRPVAAGFAPDGTMYVGDQESEGANKFYTVDTTSGDIDELNGSNQPTIDGGDLAVNEYGEVVYVDAIGNVFRLSSGSWENLDVVNGDTENRIEGDDYSSLAYASDGTYHAYEHDLGGDDTSEIDKFTIGPSEMGGMQVGGDKVIQQDESVNSSIRYGDGASCTPEPAEDPTGTVEGVKFEDDGRLGVFNDTDDERLEGWQIIALGDESTNLIAEMTVEADSEDGSTVTGLNPGDNYLVIAKGRYSFDDNNGDGFDGNEQRIADAEHSSENNFATRYKDATNNPNYSNVTSGSLDLVTSENPNPNWGDYSTSSQYSIIDNASGSSVDFYIDDTNYDDNSGSLDVRVYKLDGFSTTTDSDGEYQLELPAETYEIVEVLQDGYEQTFRSEGADEVVITDESEEEINFGNDSLDPEDDSEDGDDTTDENDQGSDAGESTGGSEPSDGGGGGGALSPGGAGDDGSDAGDDEGSVLGEQDTNGSSDSGESGSDDVTDEDILNSLTTLANELGDLQDSLGGQVAGVQDPLGFPDAGEGSLNRVAQAGAENAPADIDPTENVSTTTVEPSEVSTSSAATSSATSTESDNEDTTTTSVDDSRTGGFGWGFWVALIGLVIVAFLLYRSADEDSDDPINQETVQ